MGRSGARGGVASVWWPMLSVCRRGDRRRVRPWRQRGVEVVWLWRMNTFIRAVEVWVLCEDGSLLELAGSYCRRAEAARTAGLTWAVALPIFAA